MLEPRPAALIGALCGAWGWLLEQRSDPLSGLRPVSHWPEVCEPCSIGNRERDLERIVELQGALEWWRLLAAALIAITLLLALILLWVAGCCAGWSCCCRAVWATRLDRLEPRVVTRSEERRLGSGDSPPGGAVRRVLRPSALRDGPA